MFFDELCTGYSSLIAPNVNCTSDKSARTISNLRTEYFYLCIACFKVFKICERKVCPLVPSTVTLARSRSSSLGVTRKDTVASTSNCTRLLKKPDADCKFCEYRNWVIVNFLLNSGCRAATVRNIQIQDVDLLRKQIVLRHTKNGKVQVILLCTSMIAILRDYMAVRAGKGSDYLFCNEFGDFLTENALRLAIVKYNNTKGVDRTSREFYPYKP